MKLLLALATALGIGLSAQVASASLTSLTPMIKERELVEHGGGCRKSSPPGMCCHMDNSTGIVHCH